MTFMNMLLEHACHASVGHHHESSRAWRHTRSGQQQYMTCLTLHAPQEQGAWIRWKQEDVAENRDDIVPLAANASKGRQMDLRSLMQTKEQVTEEAASEVVVETSKGDTGDTKDVAAEGEVKDADCNVRAAADDPDGKDMLTHALEEVMDEYFASPSGGDGEGGDERADGDAVERGGRDGAMKDVDADVEDIAQLKEEDGKAHEDREKKDADVEDTAELKEEDGKAHQDREKKDADAEDTAELKKEDGKAHEDREKKDADDADVEDTVDLKEEDGKAHEDREKKAEKDHACAASGNVGEDAKLGTHGPQHVTPVEVNDVPAGAASKSDAAEGPSASCAESGSAEAPRTPTPTPVAKECAQAEECSPTQPMPTLTPAATCPKPDEPAETTDEMAGRVMLVPSPCRPKRELDAAKVTANEQQKGQKAWNACMIEKDSMSHSRIHVHCIARAYMPTGEDHDSCACSCVSQFLSCVETLQICGTGACKPSCKPTENRDDCGKQSWSVGDNMRQEWRRTCQRCVCIMCDTCDGKKCQLDM